MSDFLDKYYPGLSEKFAKERIRKVEELLEELNKDFEKKYNTKN